MSVGISEISLEVGNVFKAIEEGVTGNSDPRGNVNTLRNRFECLITNTDRRERMGKAGRKRYEEFFTFDQMFEKTYRIYEEVLSERRKG